MIESPFFDKPKLIQNEVGFVIEDGFPVSKGHCLVVPYRNYSDYFQSTDEEMIGLHRLVKEIKKYLDEKYNPDGYNIGINSGEVSGQSVGHVHIHVIPRYKGDVKNPRGGVRGVIPSKQSY